MVEINNQRMGVPRYAGVVGGNWPTDVRKQKSWLWRRLNRRKLLQLLDHPRKLVTLNPNSNQRAPDATPASFPLVQDAYRKQLGLKDFSPKSQDAVALQKQIEAWRFAYDWWLDRPSVWRRPLQQYLGFTLGYGQFEHKADSLIAKFKEAGERSEVMYEQSHRDYLRSGYLHHQSAVMGCLIVPLITPLPTKPSATKMPKRTEAGERGNYWHADASAWCCLARCKIPEGLADAKAENVLCVMMLPLVVVKFAHQSSLSVSAWSHHRLRRG